MLITVKMVKKRSFYNNISATNNIITVIPAINI